MTTLVDVQDSAFTIAKDIAEAVGYTAYQHGEQTGHIGSLAVWYDPAYQTPKAKSRNSLPWSKPFKKLLIYPRGITLYNPEYTVYIEADSSYDKWIVYTTGRIVEVERQLWTLLTSQAGVWSKIKRAWDTDLERRKKALGTARQWDTSDQPRHSLSSETTPLSETPAATSAETPTRIVPTFGDLSLLAKPTSTGKSRKTKTK